MPEVGRLLEGFIAFVERNRTNVLTGFILLSLVCFGRVALEHAVLTEETTDPSSGVLYLQSVWQWTHNVAFFAAAFLGGSVITAFFIRERVRRVFNAILLASWIVLIPPLLDGLIFNVHRYELYNYRDLVELPYNIPTFFTQASTTWGIRFEVLAILLLLIFYIWVKTKSPVKMVLTFVGIYFFAALIGSAYFFGIGEQLGPSYAHSGQIFYLELFLAICAVSTFFMIWMSDKRAVLELIRKSSFFLLSVLLLSTIVGILVGGLRPSTGVPYTENLSPLYLYHMPIIVLILVISSACWVFHTLLVLYFERRQTEQKGELSTNQIRNVCTVLLIVITIMALQLGPVTLLSVGGVLVLAVGFSYFEASHGKALASLFLGGEASLLLIAGYFPLFQWAPDALPVDMHLSGMVRMGGYIIQLPVSSTVVTFELILGALLAFVVTSISYFAIFILKRRKG